MTTIDPTGPNLDQSAIYQLPRKPKIGEWWQERKNLEHFVYIKEVRTVKGAPSDWFPDGMPHTYVTAVTATFEQADADERPYPSQPDPKEEAEMNEASIILSEFKFMQDYQIRQVRECCYANIEMNATFFRDYDDDPAAVLQRIVSAGMEALGIGSFSYLEVIDISDIEPDDELTAAEIAALGVDQREAYQQAGRILTDQEILDADMNAVIEGARMRGFPSSQDLDV